MIALHFVPSPLRHSYHLFFFGLPCFQWRDFAEAGVLESACALLQSLPNALLHSDASHLSSNLGVFISVGCAQEVALGSKRFTKLLAVLWLCIHAAMVLLRMLPGPLGALLEWLVGPTGHCDADDTMPSVGFSAILYGLIIAHHLLQLRAINRLSAASAPSLAYETVALTILIAAESTSSALRAALICAYGCLYLLAMLLRFGGRAPPPERTLRWADQELSLKSAICLARGRDSASVAPGPDEFEKIHWLFSVLLVWLAEQAISLLLLPFRLVLGIFFSFMPRTSCGTCCGDTVLWWYGAYQRKMNSYLKVSECDVSFSAVIFSSEGFDFGMLCDLLPYIVVIIFNFGDAGNKVSNSGHFTGILVGALITPVLFPARHAAAREPGLLYPGDTAMVVGLPRSPSNGQKVRFLRVLPNGVGVEAVLMGGDDNMLLSFESAEFLEPCKPSEDMPAAQVSAPVSGYKTQHRHLYEREITAPRWSWAQDDVGIELSAISLVRVKVLDDLRRNAAFALAEAGAALGSLATWVWSTGGTRPKDA